MASCLYKHLSQDSNLYTDTFEAKFSKKSFTCFIGAYICIQLM
jgi:hypothetical protein